MTFVLVAANADQIMQITAGPSPDDGVTEAGHVACDDATFLFGFTGVTASGSHLTQRWLAGALRKAGEKDRKYRGLLQGLASEADHYFQTSVDLQGLPAASRRLTIMFSGYTSDDFIINAFVSNFQDFTKAVDHPEARAKFTVHSERSISRTNGNPAAIHLIGHHRALPATADQELREMLLRRRPAGEIARKAVALVRELSGQAGGSAPDPGTVHLARMSHSDPLEPVVGLAFEDERPISPSDRIDLRSGAPGAPATPIELSAPLPVVHRNAPCPCGSGKKYRLCHRQAD